MSPLYAKAELGHKTYDDKAANDYQQPPDAFLGDLQLQLSPELRLSLCRLNHRFVVSTMTIKINGAIVIPSESPGDLVHFIEQFIQPFLDVLFVFIVHFGLAEHEEHIAARGRRSSEYPTRVTAAIR